MSGCWGYKDGEAKLFEDEKAMKAAARDVVAEILNELDPDTLDAGHMGVLGRKKMLNTFTTEDIHLLKRFVY